MLVYVLNPSKPFSTDCNAATPTVLADWGNRKKKQIHEESPCHEGFGRTLGSKGSDLDLGYHFQTAVTICLAQRQNLCNKSG
jgi:hypothetical protein